MVEPVITPDKSIIFRNGIRLSFRLDGYFGRAQAFRQQDVSDILRASQAQFQIRSRRADGVGMASNTYGFVRFFEPPGQFSEIGYWLPVPGL